MKVVCIVNPKAGSDTTLLPIVETVRRVAGEQGWDAACVMTEESGQATDLAREASRDAELVLAAGGDGTVQEVARGLIGSTAALGVIPAGSGNGLARALGLPLDPVKAIEALPGGEVRRIDAITVNDHPFFRAAGFGLDAEVSRRYNAASHGRGTLPCLWFAVRAWATYEPETVRITINGQTVEERITILVVANTEQYGAGAKIASGAKPDDGVFRLARLLPVPVWRWPLILPRLIRGTLRRSPLYRATDAVEAVVERERAGPLTIDGEPTEMGRVLRYGILPGALRVWMPVRDCGSDTPQKK